MDKKVLYIVFSFPQVAIREKSQNKNNNQPTKHTNSTFPRAMEEKEEKMWKYIVVVLFPRLEKDGGRLLLKKFEIGKSAAGGGGRGGGGYGRGRKGEERFFVPFLLLLLSLHLSWKRRRRREKFKKSLRRRRRRRSGDGLPLFSFWKVKQGCQVGRIFLPISGTTPREHFLLKALSRPSACFVAIISTTLKMNVRTISQII